MGGGGNGCFAIPLAFGDDTRQTLKLILYIARKLLKILEEKYQYIFCRGDVDDDSAFTPLWIGLYNEEQFEEDSACRVDLPDLTDENIAECRDKFVWVDGSSRTDFQRWGFDEPNSNNDKCVRLEQNQWVASPCGLELGYICREGNMYILHNYVHLKLLFCHCYVFTCSH